MPKVAEGRRGGEAGAGAVLDPWAYSELSAWIPAFAGMTRSERRVRRTCSAPFAPNLLLVGDRWRQGGTSEFPAHGVDTTEGRSGSRFSRQRTRWLRPPVQFPPSLPTPDVPPAQARVHAEGPQPAAMSLPILHTAPERHGTPWVANAAPGAPVIPCLNPTIQAATNEPPSQGRNTPPPVPSRPQKQTGDGMAIPGASPAEFSKLWRSDDQKNLLMPILKVWLVSCTVLSKPPS